MDQKPPEKQLPHRFRESSFRNYEGAIDTVVKAWPFAYSFVPDNVETFSCRLRDAMTSLREHRWSTYIDMVKFLQIHSSIRVAIKPNGSVRCGPREIDHRSGAPVEEPKTQFPTSGQSVITDPDIRAIESLMYLHHTRILTTPSLIQFTEGEFDPSKWEENYDVAIESLGEGKFKVL